MASRIADNTRVRHTKVVATLGPATDDLVPDLVEQGVNVFRLNFSHGTHEEHAGRVRRIRAAAEKRSRYVAILADLQGPKIRITSFADTDAVQLEVGAPFTIDTALAADAGDQHHVGTTYTALSDEVSVGDVLVLGDGIVELRVVKVQGSTVQCEVHTAGRLGAKQGINKRGGGLSAKALTAKDLDDLKFACAQGVDYIAVSFPRDAADMEYARELIETAGASCGLVAKLERAEAVADPQTLDGIILASDAVMVARGDLGIEIGDARLIGMQKHIIARARALGRAVITATQMMESMITNPRATRAEVMDVANAVLDGTDAVMLSGETAVGAYPLKCVRSMVGIILGAESSEHVQVAPTEPFTCSAVDEAVAISVMSAAQQLQGLSAVACLTASGNTPQLMSRMRTHLPIYALANHEGTLARVALLRSVQPVMFSAYAMDFDAVNTEAIKILKQAGVVNTGDLVILTKGDYRNVQGGTNTMKVLSVD